MEDDRMPKKIFTQELEGTRRRGRPRKGWKEEVERDLQVLGVRRWRELVADRKEGRALIDRPKSTVGCNANGRRRRILVALLAHHIPTLMSLNSRLWANVGLFRRTVTVIL